VRDAGIRSEFLLHLLRSRDEMPMSLNLKSTDPSAAGSTEAFLKTPLRYIIDEVGQEIVVARIEDGSEVGVMMGWERDISSILLSVCEFQHDNPVAVQHTVDKLTRPFLGSDGVNILNIGFGLGIVSFHSKQTKVALILQCS
jgi:type IV protein arginine methyltransferase